MTLIVGIKCSDGVVLGADGAATYGSLGGPTIRQPTRKIHIIDDCIAVGVSGPVGLGQRIVEEVQQLWDKKDLSGIRPVTAMDKIRRAIFNPISCEWSAAASATAVLGQGRASASASSATLMAVPVKKEMCLFSFDHLGAPEQANADLPFVSVGSGQNIADPFLAFLRRIFWKDQAPSLRDGEFVALWSLRHAIATHPGGVADPIQIVVLEKSGGDCKARELTEGEKEEHLEAIASAEEHLAKFGKEMNPAAPFDFDSSASDSLRSSARRTERLCVGLNPVGGGHRVVLFWEPMAKAVAPIDHVLFVFDDLVRFSQMSFEQAKAHHEQHPEDALCQIPAEAPRGGHHPMSRESVRRLGAIARRVADLAPDGHSFSYGELQRQLRKTFAGRFRQRADITEGSVARWMNASERATRAKHKALLHYLPCVFVSTEATVEFTVGEVKFVPMPTFLSDQSATILADLRSQYHVAVESQIDIAERMIQEIRTHFAPYRWVAQVSVPACDGEVSRDRAEAGVRATLDVLRMLFEYRAEDLRLSVEPAPATRLPRLTRDPGGRFRCGLTTEGEGPSVEKEWFENIPEDVSRWLNLAGAAVKGILDPSEMSAHRDRWLDALDWFGQAVVERRPATALVKLVAAMERLTTCSEDKREIAERVSRRTALLSHDDYPDVLRTAAQMKVIYNKRSRLMHGDARPSDRETPALFATARRIAIRALHGSLVALWH